jgi:hypothetical protein
VGRSTKCYSIENGGLSVSEARSRHPTCKESNDAASEPRHPQIRNEDNGLHTWQGGGVREQSDLTHRRHRVSDKIAMHGCSLDVRGNYDGVLP